MNPEIDPMPIQLKPDEFRLVKAVARGEAVDLAKVAETLDLRAQLAEEVVEYVLSEEYAGDFKRVITRLGLRPADVFAAADRLEPVEVEPGSFRRQLENILTPPSPWRPSRWTSWVPAFGVGIAASVFIFVLNGQHQRELAQLRDEVHVLQKLKEDVLALQNIKRDLLDLQVKVEERDKWTPEVWAAMAKWERLRADRRDYDLALAMPLGTRTMFRRGWTQRNLERATKNALTEKDFYYQLLIELEAWRRDRFVEDQSDVADCLDELNQDCYRLATILVDGQTPFDESSRKLLARRCLAWMKELENQARHLKDRTRKPSEVYLDTEETLSRIIAFLSEEAAGGRNQMFDFLLGGAPDDQLLFR